MAQSINLIPQQEIQIQTQAKVLSTSTIVSFVFLGLTVVASLTFFLIANSLRNQVNDTNLSIESLRNSIKSKSDIEIVARNVDKKYELLSGIIKNQPYYSKLLQEIMVRKPYGVNITSLSMGADSTIDISGKATDYLLVSDFINKLTDKNFADGNQDLKALFTGVSLPSVNLENAGGVAFSLQIKFDSSKLKGNL